MARIEDRLELFRGQIEELQGKMERALGQLEGPRGVPTMLRGQGREIRGKARQTMARARMSAQDISESFARHPENFLPFIGLFAFGLTVASLAIFFPRTLNQIWNWLQGRAPEAMRAGRQTAEMGMGAGMGTSAGMGTPTGGTRP